MADTKVLKGDGTKDVINDLHVGQRLATDGGLSNSGKADAYPNSTKVDPATWRLVIPPTSSSLRP